MMLDAVQNAIQKLKEERDRLDAAIGQLEGLTQGHGVGRGRRRRGRRMGRGRRGRPRAGGRLAGGRLAGGRLAGGRLAGGRLAGGGREGGNRKNAPRGLLKQKIHEVLKSSKRPLAPVELRNRIIAAGYPVKNPKTLYSALFAATKTDPRVKKTKKGFSLKAGR